MIETVLVRWEGQPTWHFAQSRNHGTTACGLQIPLADGAPEYAEISITEITSFKGTCKKCFHEICIEVQDTELWAVYYAYIAGQP